MSADDSMSKRRLSREQATAISRLVQEKAPGIQFRIEDLGDDQATIAVLRHRDNKRTHDDLKVVTDIAKDVLGYEPTRNEIERSHLYALGEGKPITR